MVVNAQSVAESFVSLPFGIRASDPVTVFGVGDGRRQRVALDERVGERPDERALDRPFVGEGVDHSPECRVVERDPVGGAVLGIDRDDEVRTGSERAAQGLAQVLAAVGAVDEDERQPIELGRAEPGVVELDEPARVGSDLVVVDLVQNHVRRRLRGRRRKAGEGDDAAGFGSDDQDARQPGDGRARGAAERRDRRRPGRPWRSGSAADVPLQRLLVAGARDAGRGHPERARRLVAAGTDHVVVEPCLEHRAGRRTGEDEHRRCDHTRAEHSSPSVSLHRSSSRAGRSRDSCARARRPVSETARPVPKGRFCARIGTQSTHSRDRNPHSAPRPATTPRSRPPRPRAPRAAPARADAPRQVVGAGGAGAGRRPLRVPARADRRQGQERVDRRPGQPEDGERPLGRQVRLGGAGLRAAGLGRRPAGGGPVARRRASRSRARSSGRSCPP